jgi:hypothetical protein
MQLRSQKPLTISAVGLKIMSLATFIGVSLALSFQFSFFKTTSFLTDLVFCILLLHPLVKTETLTSTSKTFLLHIYNSLRTSMHPIDNLSRIT